MDRCVLLAGKWKRGRSRSGVRKRPGVAPDACGELRLGAGLGSGLPMDASVAAYSCRRVACEPLTLLSGLSSHQAARSSLPLHILAMQVTVQH